MSERNLPLPWPIACSLNQAELATRRSELLPGLLGRADSQEAILEGFRWGFRDTSNALLNDIISVIEAERRCCQFLRFRLTFEPDGGPLWLEASGPEGTQEFLRSMLIKVPPPTPTSG